MICHFLTLTLEICLVILVHVFFSNLLTPGNSEDYFFDLKMVLGSKPCVRVSHEIRVVIMQMCFYRNLQEKGFSSKPQVTFMAISFYFTMK